MKTLISLFLCLFLSLISPTFAGNIPTSVADADTLITSQRGNPIDVINKICITDKKLIASAATAYYNSVMMPVEKWKTDIEATRTLTNGEMIEYNAVKSAFTLEKSKPDLTTWRNCDEAIKNFRQWGKDQLIQYKVIETTVRSEYPTATLIVVNPKVKAYTSISTGKQVAVVNKKDMTSQAKTLAQYDTVVSLMTDNTGKVVKYTVLIKNDIVNNRLITFYNVRVEGVNIQTLHKLYNSFWPATDKENLLYGDPVKGYPTSIKVGSIYYTGK
jgi:hypothetical protein